MKRRRKIKTAAYFVLVSQNHKTGPVAATYASIEATCPKDCAFKDAGCYAKGGRVGILNAQLVTGVTPLQAAVQEARQIEAVRPPLGLALRLHVSGDCRTVAAARRLGRAGVLWQDRGGGSVWTYTHAWRLVPRGAWGRGVSVLASIEHVGQAAAARKAGYAPALVVPAHPKSGRAWRAGGVRWIPCPEQTRGIPCASCGLCFKADELRDRGAGIAFAAHSQGKKHVLRVIQES